MSKPLVSVVIPTYNCPPEILSQAIDTVFAQKRLPASDHQIELIVVDDGSDIPVKDLGQYIKQIRIDHQGVSVARNVGIKEARGTWIAFLDDDDTWATNKLAMQITLAEETKADFCSCWMYGTTAEGGQLYRSTNWRDLAFSKSLGVYYALYPPGSLTRACLRGEQFHSPSAWIIRRDVCPKFPEHMTMAEDWAFTLEVSRKLTMLDVQVPLVCYRPRTNEPEHWAKHSAWDQVLKHLNDNGVVPQSPVWAYAQTMKALSRMAGYSASWAPSLFTGHEADCAESILKAHEDCPAFFWTVRPETRDHIPDKAYTHARLGFPRLVAAFAQHLEPEARLPFVERLYRYLPVLYSLKKETLRAMIQSRVS